MAIIHISKPLEIPAVWQNLLDIGNFDEIPPYPAKARNKTPIGYPAPLRDDSRLVSVEENGIRVILGLYSGNHNYWLSYEVFDAGEPVCEGSSDVLFDIPGHGTDVIITDSGDEIVFPIQITGRG